MAGVTSNEAPLQRLAISPVGALTENNRDHEKNVLQQQTFENLCDENVLEYRSQRLLLRAMKMMKRARGRDVYRQGE